MDHDPARARKVVERIEARLGTKLPVEYRNFVLTGLPWGEKRRRSVRWKAGGGWPNVVEVERPYHYEVFHEEPFGTGIVKNVTLEFMLDVFEEREPGDGVIPDEAIAIAGCPTYEEVLLFVRGARAGQVWLKDWLRLEQEEIDDPEDGLHFLARDFNEFLAMLSDEDPAAGE